ncbi:putative lipid II flippase FtsW [Paenibacillus sp.]|uniref:putative lipid II flippase FtsW n=1 Tax=Paenibacillus sp. TaxID=58172 RepID=UPI002D374286|nr:putative lipid II flippase FtsW [Paenibacillus sp.]HZG54946.1 putative lipid II flippase FtsW [Paenibacillus sp.]
MARRGTPDFFLFLMTVLLVGFGIVMVFSASGPEAATQYGDALWYTKKQILAAGLGVVLMLAFMNVPFLRWKKLYLPFFVGVVGLLVFVLTQPAGERPRSWIDFGVMSIQPAEFAKLAIIIYLASIITRKGEKFEQFRTGLLPVALVVGSVGGLILMQPDFGSTVVFLFCAAIVIVAGGANLRHLLLGVVAIAVAGTLFLGGKLISGDDGGERGYQMKRIECYLDPWHDTQNWCWQQVQAEMAFGHGGVTGAGFGQSVQKLFYLPEAQNDFIFAIIGEELGFIGVTVFLLLYLAFLWRGIIVSLRCADPFGTLVGIGIVGMFGIQAFINIGGVTRAIPMTGITLPFISAGGSSLLVSLMSMGVLLSVSRGTVPASKPAEPKANGRKTKGKATSRVPEHVPMIR